MSTQTAHGDGAAEALVRLPSDDGVLEFAGRQIASVSTQQPGKLRWVELSLYQLTDGTGRYVLARTGRSIAYHRDGGSCHRGSRVPASTISHDSQPCPACRPPAPAVAKAQPGLSVFAEADYHGAAVCESVTDVLTRLRLPDPVSSGSSASSAIRGSFSEPAQRLLLEARHADPAVERALSVTRRV